MFQTVSNSLLLFGSDNFVPKSRDTFHKVAHQDRYSLFTFAGPFCSASPQTAQPCNEQEPTPLEVLGFTATDTQKLEASTRRLGVLLLVASEQRGKEKLESRMSNFLSNLGHTVGQAGETRKCSLCHKPAGADGLECDNRTVKRIKLTTRMERLTKSAERWEGHVTCLACLRKRQGVTKSDIMRGAEKVCKFIYGRRFLLSLSPCLSNLKPLCILQMLQGE